MIDVSAADAWLSCRRQGASECESASAATPGGQIAEAARSTFGTDPPAPVPPPTVESVAALLAEMRHWPAAAEQVARYLPVRVDGRLRAFVVANGHPWGDAYVRPVRHTDGRFVLGDDGEPVIVLNALLLAAQYGDTPREQAAAALGVLSHEVFHQLFSRYRRGDPAWQRFEAGASPERKLQEILLDEGVAHFIDRRDELLRDGFPIERSKAALAALATAIQQLRTNIPAAQAEQLLHAANEGRYWDKFGSISGMLLSYAVYRAFGMDGLRRAIRCGPGGLVGQYGDAARAYPELPRMPDELMAWASSASLCPPGASPPR